MKINLTQQEKDKKFMNKPASRNDVTNFVMNLLYKEVVPSLTQHIQLSAMVMESILIRKGVCTGDEIESITNEIINEHIKRKAQGASEGNTKLEFNADKTSHTDDESLGSLGGISFSSENSSPSFNPKFSVMD